MSEYKQCPNGHYYQGNSCPYCPSSEIESGENRLYNVCPNGHCYDSIHDACPFCGENESITAFEWGLDTRFNKNIKVIITENEGTKAIDLNGILYYDYYCISIGISKGYKDSYNIMLKNNDIVEVKPEDKLVFGRTPMTGKEFIKMCDIIIDNNIELIGI